MEHAGPLRVTMSEEHQQPKLGHKQINKDSASQKTKTVKNKEPAKKCRYSYSMICLLEKKTKIRLMHTCRHENLLLSQNHLKCGHKPTYMHIFVQTLVHT